MLALQTDLKLCLAVFILLSTLMTRVEAQMRGDVGRGATVFRSMNCAMCHPGGGNAIRPEKPLKGAGFANKYRDDESIAVMIREGSPNGVMPPFRESQMTTQQLFDVIAYVRSLTPKPQVVGNSKSKAARPGTDVKKSPATKLPPKRT